MIHIDQDQNIIENENLKVLTPTGDYEDTALIEFYDINNPDFTTGTFQAQYIKYGGVVYKFNGPKELGEEILKIDPESTHTAASYVRMTNELLDQMNTGSLEPSSLDQVITDEQIKTEEQMLNNEEPIVEENIEEPISENPVEEIPVTTTTENTIIVEPTPEEVVIPEITPENLIPAEEPISMITRKIKRKIG